jgi:very-short-patch-repair endonuclease
VGLRSGAASSAKYPHLPMPPQASPAHYKGHGPVPLPEGEGKGARMPDSIQRARSLRVNCTDAEAVLWQKVRNSHLGYKFCRQVPMGIYTADFACLELKLVVEFDGGQHVDSRKDEIRTKFLNSLGFEVVRYWNNEIVENIDGVLENLKDRLLRRKSTLILPHPCASRAYKGCGPLLPPEGEGKGTQ